MQKLSEWINGHSVTNDYIRIPRETVTNFSFFQECTDPLTTNRWITNYEVSFQSKLSEENSKQRVLVACFCFSKRFLFCGIFSFVPLVYQSSVTKEFSNVPNLRTTNSLLFVKFLHASNGWHWWWALYMYFVSHLKVNVSLSVSIVLISGYQLTIFFIIYFMHDTSLNNIHLKILYYFNKKNHIYYWNENLLKF